MSTVKRTLVNVSFYDPEAIQRKLEQMATRGWMIQKVGNLFWTYKVKGDGLTKEYILLDSSNTK